MKDCPLLLEDKVLGQMPYMLLEGSVNLGSQGSKKSKVNQEVTGSGKKREDIGRAANMRTTRAEQMGEPQETGTGKAGKQD